MTFTNFNIFSILSFFTVNLLVTTYYRKTLTYKGVQIYLILNNLILFFFCTYIWQLYIVNQQTNSFILKLNSNNWVGVSYELNFKINSLSFLFIFLVNVIGLATNVYILNYFKYEERAEEFMLLLNWFILSMIVLVSGNNFFTLILGWELIGLTSFLLINFWKFKVTTLTCSFKAFSFNKFSDLLLMLSFCILWNSYKINDVETLLNYILLNKSQNITTLYYSALSLLICSSIKSAQIIGHLWLPDSMEAPVPASSLIHSATLVSAGIYLILKFQIIFMLTKLMYWVFMLGSITACYGGIVAASQTDVKKILAYSTISHCGFIFTTITFNNFVVTIVYLYLHGLFKALTFFCVGSLIKYNNTQDTRLMGVNKTQPFNTTVLIIAAINLGGLPFTFGYMYKQLFLSYLTITNYSTIGYGFCLIGILTSIVYVYKLIYYSCFDFRKGYLQTTILLLQNYKNIDKNKFITFNYIKLIAFLIIYIFSIFFFLVIKTYILKINIFFSHSPKTLVNDYKYLSTVFFLKKHLITLYYSFYSFVVIVLILNNWRTNYFILDKFGLLKNIILLILAYNFINFILKYICFFLM